MATQGGVAQLASHTPNAPCEMPYQALMSGLQSGMDSMSTVNRCPTGAKPVQSHVGAAYGSPTYATAPAAVANVGRTGQAPIHPAAVAAAVAQTQQQQQQQQQARPMGTPMQQQQRAPQPQQQQQQAMTIPATPSDPMVTAVFQALARSIGGGVAGHEEDVRRAIMEANAMNGGYAVNAKMLTEMKNSSTILRTYDLEFMQSLKSLAANPQRAELVVPWHRIARDANSVSNASGMVMSVHTLKFQTKLPASVRLDIAGVEGEKHSITHDVSALDFFHPNTEQDYTACKGEQLFVRKFAVPIEHVQKYAGSDIESIFASRIRVPGQRVSMVAVGSALHNFFKNDPELSVAKFGKPADTFPTVAGQFMLFGEQRLEDTYQELKAIKAQMQERSFADGLPISIKRADGRSWDDPVGVCDHYQGHVATDILEQPNRFFVQLQIGFLLPQAKP